MEESELIRRANEIAAKHGLTAELWPDALTVGVEGDGRSYLPTICIMGPHPGWDAIREISDQITNTLPVGRVTYETAVRK